MLSRRDALTTDERAARSETICERAVRLVEQQCVAGALIALYANKGSEVATSALDAALRARGFRVAYPRVLDGERVLAFAEVAIGELVPSRYGLREPAADAPRVALDEIAAFVVPGLAFDRSGGRIGWGMGHYDATLGAAGAAKRIGLAFECQLVDRVPRESHDAVLEAIITEVTTHVVV